jgi:hypothetical protein
MLSLPMNVTYAFANATTTQYLSSLDADFNQLAWTLNGVSNGTVALANVKINGGTISKSTLAANGSPTSSTFLRGDGTWAVIPSTSGGTVTSIDVSGGSTGLTSSGGPVSTSGTITLAGTLNVANGGTGTNASTGTGSVVLSVGPTLTNANISGLTLTTPLNIPGGGTGIGTVPNYGQILIGNSVGYTLSTITAGSGISITNGPGSISIAASSNSSGTVTSVSGSGTYGFNLTGGPVTTSGTLTVTPPAPGTSGNVLTSNGTAWVSQAVSTPNGAKAWAVFDGASSSPITPAASYNISSITKSGTGLYTLNFTSAMSNANYAILGNAQGTYATNFAPIVATQYSTTPTTTSFSIQAQADSGALWDLPRISVIVFGN